MENKIITESSCSLLLVVLPSFSFCSIVFIFFPSLAILPCFQFSPFFILSLLFLTVPHSFVSRESSFCLSSSNLLCV